MVIQISSMETLNLQQELKVGASMDFAKSWKHLQSGAQYSSLLLHMVKNSLLLASNQL
jgi:hypothetical protein